MVVSPDGKGDLLWWLTNIHDMYAPIHLPPISNMMSCDASGKGCGAVMGNVSTGGAWLSGEISVHINVKEMIAIYYGLRSFIHNVTNVHVRVLTDNTTAVSVINNMGTTRSPECNIIAQKIWKFCKQHNTWITCAHIPGVENVQSDYESRKEYRQAEWMLNRDYYLQAIEKFEFEPDLDCFASRINCQTKMYASFKPDPYASFINAFSINWQDYKCYLFPPFSVIAQALQKLRVDKATALCVLPHWPTQSWWPLMNLMLVKGPWILKSSSRNLLLPNHMDEVHPLHHKLKLVICLLSGIIINPKDSMQRL